MPIISRRRRAFTLVELLVVITIIGILASLLLGTLFFAGEKARATRTRSMVARLDQAVTIRWETYRTRRVPIDPQAALAGNANVHAMLDFFVANRALADDALVNDPPLPFYGGGNPFQISAVRLMALRELQRLELPHRWADVTEDSSQHPTAPAPTLAFLGTWPSLSRAYLSRYNGNALADGTLAAPTDLYQGAECLYLIVTMGAQGDDVDSADKFRSADVGDVDEDGMLEFLDGWGRPISFIRWAPGFVSELQPDADPAVAGTQRDALNNHDPFDPLKCDLSAAAPPRGWRMFPLVYSPGPDGAQDIWATSAAVNYNDPYGIAAGDPLPGAPFDAAGDGLNDLDNIHNHALAGQVR